MLSLYIWLEQAFRPIGVLNGQQQQQQQLYFLTLNIQISHHQQIARLIEAGGVWTA